MKLKKISGKELNVLFGEPETTNISRISVFLL